LAWLLHIEIKNELVSTNDLNFQSYIYVTRHCLELIDAAEDLKDCALPTLLLSLAGTHLWVFAFIQLDGEFVFQPLKYLSLVAPSKSSEYKSIFCFFWALKQAVNALEEFYKEVLNKSQLTLKYPYPQQYINEKGGIVKFNYEAKVGNNYSFIARTEDNCKIFAKHNLAPKLLYYNNQDLAYIGYHIVVMEYIEAKTLCMTKDDLNIECK